MKSLLALAIVLAPSLASAQIPANYEATAHGRVLACYGEAYTIIELVDVATKNLTLIAGESTKEVTPARLQIVMGMVAAGTIGDQQQALDVVERLEECVATAVERATPDAAARFAAGALAEEVAIGIMMADGFISDYKQSATVIDKVLASGGDASLRATTNSVFSRFGATMKSALERVRIACDQLIEKSTAK
jgi:hypothetical protein